MYYMDIFVSFMLIHLVNIKKKLHLSEGGNNLIENTISLMRSSTGARVAM